MSASSSDRSAIRFEDVCFAYDGRVVFDNARFHVHSGEFAALVGPNGAGKTTALKLILALAKPSSGVVRVFGNAPEASRGRIGYVPQHAHFDPAFPVTVREVVKMGTLRGLSGRYTREDDAGVDESLELAGIADLGARPYSALSGGQRRRVLVARALAGKPDLLALDEPTANMDVESERGLYQALGAVKGKATVLIVTHDSQFVSSLVDAVFCVGERGPGIMKHRAAPTTHAAPSLFGGEALEVLHDTALPLDGCCGGEDAR